MYNVHIKCRMSILNALLHIHFSYAKGKDSEGVKNDWRKTGKDSSSTPFCTYSRGKRGPIRVFLLHHLNDHDVVSWVLPTLFHIMQRSREPVNKVTEDLLLSRSVSVLPISLLSLS